ncbi:unnamed protein product [Calypogeia fissa]
MDYSEGLDIKQVQRWLAVLWLLAAGPLIVAALPVPALEPLRKCLFPVMRRGKLLRSNESAGKGFQKFTVPQSFFTHFYVLGLIWTTALFFTALGFAVICSNPASPEEHNLSSLAAQLVNAPMSYLQGDSSMGDIEKYGKDAWRLVFLLLLFEIHLTRRLYECLFVSSFSPSARMNFFGYIIGLGFYTAVPLTLFLQGFQEEGFFSAFKGFLKQKFSKHGLLSMDGPNTWDMMYFLWTIGWMRFVGAALCLYGSVHQHLCHEILASLRPTDKPSMSNRYGIPRGDWFELVSSAHYLAEIVIYAGFLIAGGGTNPFMWVLFISVVANLYLLAKPTHEWYLSKFEDYPKTRHALFPSLKQIRANGS